MAAPPSRWTTGPPSSPRSRRPAARPRAGLVSKCRAKMTARSLLGLLPTRVWVSALHSGRAASWWVSESQLNKMRGGEIAVSSQEPMVALDPMFSDTYGSPADPALFRGVPPEARPRRSPRSCSARWLCVNTDRGCEKLIRTSCRRHRPARLPSLSRSAGEPQLPSPTSPPPRSRASSRPRSSACSKPWSGLAMVMVHRVRCMHQHVRRRRRRVHRRGRVRTAAAVLDKLIAPVHDAGAAKTIPTSKGSGYRSCGWRRSQSMVPPPRLLANQLVSARCHCTKERLSCPAAPRDSC